MAQAEAVPHWLPVADSEAQAELEKEPEAQPLSVGVAEVEGHELGVALPPVPQGEGEALSVAQGLAVKLPLAQALKVGLALSVGVREGVLQGEAELEAVRHTVVEREGDWEGEPE